MADPRLEQLFEKYLAKQCRPAEVEELIRLLQHEDAEASLSPALRRIWEQIREDGETYPVNWQGMYEQVIAHETLSEKKWKLKRRTLWRMAAAAAVVLMLMGGGYLWYYNPQGHQTRREAVPLAKEILPGGTHAVLTLGNGKQITLNAVAGGALARQGRMQVIKLGSGQLAYRPIGGSARLGEVQYNTLATPRGGQYQLILPDGSKVWLNAASSIRFPTAFTGKVREVAITGEAYFEIAPDAGKPFIVTNGTVSIRVLGTHFNVNAYEDETRTKVTLLEGKVKVTTANGASAMLTSNKQAIIGKDSQTITVRKDVDVDETMAWKNGLFVFHNDDLVTIMRRLQRWYDVEVKYEYNQAAASHFTGAIRRDVKLSEVFKMLELTGGAHFLIEGRTIIVKQ